MSLQFHPPSFLRPLEYEGISNLPRGLDEIIDANLRRKAMQEQRQLLGLQIQGARSDQAFNQFQRRTALGGLNPGTITEDQYQAAMRQPAAGPFATSAPQTGLPQAQPMGPTSSVPSQLSNLAPSTDIPESVNVSKLRELFQMRKQSTALESLEKMTRTRKEAAQTGLYEAQAEALRRGDIYFDPVSGSQMAVPHGAKPLPRSERPALENQLRDELNKQSGQFDQVSAAYSKIVSAFKSPSAAGDMAAIFGFMKIVDPNSTVREGEFATAQNAGSVPQKIMNLYNRTSDGTRLTPEQRADFLRQAKGVFQAEAGLQSQREQNYGDMAERNKVSRQNVVLPRTLSPDILETEKTILGLPPGGSPHIDITARIRELAAKGMDRATIKATLQREGY